MILKNNNKKSIIIHLKKRCKLNNIKKRSFRRRKKIKRKLINKIFIIDCLEVVIKKRELIASLNQMIKMFIFNMNRIKNSMLI